MNIKTIILIILVLPLISCNNRDTKNDHSQKKDTIIVTKDIPVNRKGEAVLYNQLCSSRDYLGKLDTLELGYDSLQIRLWYAYHLKNPEEHIVVIKKDSTWSAELHDIAWFRNDDTAYIVKREIKQGMPRIGWPSFIDSLVKLNILTLPDQTKVPDMHLVYNAPVIIVEVATKTTYRQYAYTVPLDFVNKFSQARDLEKIMDLIEDQLGFKRIHKI